MIKSLLRTVLVNAVALFVVSQLISGFHLANGFRSILIVTLVFSAIHVFVKPIIKAILGPINFLTLGLISSVIDIGILYGLSVFLPQVSFSEWAFPGIDIYGFVLPAYNFNPLGSTIVAALVINLIRSSIGYLASP